VTQNNRRLLFSLRRGWYPVQPPCRLDRFEGYLLCFATLAVAVPSGLPLHLGFFGLVQAVLFSSSGPADGVAVFFPDGKCAPTLRLAPIGWRAGETGQSLGWIGWMRVGLDVGTGGVGVTKIPLARAQAVFGRTAC
jgi:hypothetical protein